MFLARSLSNPRALTAWYTPFNHQSRRVSTTRAEGSKPGELVIVPAANSKVSQGILPRALASGQQVLTLTGNIEKSRSIYREHMQNPNLQFAEIDHGDYADAGRVSAVVRGATQGKTFDHLGLVNTLGGTRSEIGTPDGEDVLRFKNIEQPRGFLVGALEGTEGRVGQVGVVNISSIAASISDRGRCTYARIRGEGEEAVTNAVGGSRVQTLTHLRVGLVQPRMHMDEETGELALHSGHNHSAENWRDYPVITVGGKDDQPLQQPVGLDCVAKGALAATSRDFGPDHWVVNGVSRQTMTQREYLTYFTKDKKVLCVHVPLDVLHAMTRMVADGRLQPYAIFILEALEHNPGLLNAEDFEQLLGSSAETLDEMYSESRMDSFKHDGPKLMRYIAQFMMTSFKNPGDALEFTKAVFFAKGWDFTIIDRTERFE